MRSVIMTGALLGAVLGASARDLALKAAVGVDACEIPVQA